MRITLCKFLLSAGISLLAVAAQSARSQDYPSKPVRLIVPYPAGGVVDLLARAITEKIAQNWGRAIVVEPRPGGNANIGAEAVANSAPDGYTLLVAAPYFAVNPHLYANLRYGPKSFAAAGLVATLQNAWVVPVSLPVGTLKELVDYAKARPGKLNALNPGSGTYNYLGQELLWESTGLEIVSVPYQGQPPAIPDLINGRLHAALIALAFAVPHVKAGRLRALAVSAPARSKELPDVPTLSEAGYGETMMVPWYGIVAPAGTPRDIVGRLNAEINKALKSPEVIDRLEKIGAQVISGSVDDMDALIRSEFDRSGKLIKARNIKGE